jgi:hypothetical protein
MPISDDIREVLMQREPGAAIAQALDALLDRDHYLFHVDANERSLTHRFGIYLQGFLPDWHVDCEYNRTGPDAKRYVTPFEQIELLELQGDIADTDGKTVFPDVIAHHRDTTDNYLVMEFKKTSSQVGDEVDFRKLNAFKHDPRLRYLFAIFVELQVGRVPGVARVIWVD